MKKYTEHLGALTAFLLIIMSHSSLADGKMQSSQVNAGELSKTTAIHVHLFDTTGADLGKPKFSDTANAMAKSAPHLLAADIVEALRHAGFTAVTLDESEKGPSDDALNLTGRFTKLHPGSQNMRVWIGFGAGESKVCISGEVTNASGENLANFSDCRNGLGWGASAQQGDKGAEILGERVAGFLVDWAE
ncbi:MAG: DUF4410 domain-containing protein [Halioglobus sp.]